MHVAIITARGGSKGIYRKNLALLNGHPLIAWTIAAALKSGVFDNIIVSSDDSEILSTSVLYGASPLLRPSHLATDTASSFETLMHAVHKFQEDVNDKLDCVTLLQPTSPLRNEEHIKEASACLTEQANGVISVYQPSPHPMKAYRIDNNGNMEGMYGSDMPYRPRQSLPKYCYANGAIYIFRYASLKNNDKFPHENIMPYFMSQADSVDIDAQEDLILAEKILRERHESISRI
ncbi:cytidylyltransferase domain-containing protein [Salinicola peritrichatus]|uniref:acylneuraminate cytidylyltransferase family protein n=1 Tax=Salinicola peritrichatus TaxID=1267424 RepID=UPI000DA16404|nr:acylneuraminate cytidylyltransferase family protein [Salinicola peritrichatus]